MDQKRPKDWRELCKLAANELDPEKLMVLIAEINKALDERDQKRKSENTNSSGHETSSWPDRQPVWGT